MIITGLTGGIGAGKTTVAQIFQHFGVPVYYADDAAKRLMIENQSLVEAIKKVFGNQSYHPDGSLNRKFLADQVFSDPKAKEKLNHLVHPAVRKDTQTWVKQKENKHPVLVKEAAIIFESGIEDTFDYIITVDAPKELRIRRLLTRNQTTRDAILKRMQNQMDPELKKQKSDFVILNDEKNALIPQVHQVLSSLKRISNVQK